MSQGQATKCLSIIHGEMDPCTLFITSVDQLNLSVAPTRDTPKELQMLLDEFGSIFQEVVGLPPPRLQDHRIPLVDEKVVVKVRPYGYLMVQKSELERLVREILQAGIIMDSYSPFASLVLTVRNRFPIPIIEELLDELGQAKIFSKLDLMFEANIPKTTFKTHEGHYKFLVMRFGLTNALSTFQALINSILSTC
ncbi:reverse transcriptase [Gossypium australe]|uniref:Reverse transcriptase n=1 Tax=Gossypium australe TaxID=47621 RepID=A0A5B6UXF4_9ROSI|nr:reverse transcriptase [Gossypium australe]